MAVAPTCANANVEIIALLKAEICAVGTLNRVVVYLLKLQKQETENTVTALV